MDNQLIKHSVVELIGTYFLLFFGTGAMVVNSLYDNMLTHLGVAFAWGFVVLAMIYSLGSKSGAHINPAVTLAFYLDKRISLRKTVLYIVFQLIGALLASLTLKFMFPESLTLGETIPSNSWEQAFIMEFILSFFLMFVIFNVANGSKEEGITAAFAIGMAVMICALLGGPISVASMNPARSFGPGIVSGNLEHFWIYIVAPVAGMISSLGVYKIIKE